MVRPVMRPARSHRAGAAPAAGPRAAPRAAMYFARWSGSPRNGRWNWRARQSIRRTNGIGKESGARTGAVCGAKSCSRIAQRKGCRDRDGQARAGSVALRLPRLRTGSCFPPFLEPRRSVEKALAGMIREACVHGGRTSSMDDLIQATGGTVISRSQVSRLRGERVIFRLRSEDDCEPRTRRCRPGTADRRRIALRRGKPPPEPFLFRPGSWIGATSLNVREGGRTVRVAVTLAVGANSLPAKAPSVRARWRTVRGPGHGNRRVRGRAVPGRARGFRHTTGVTVPIHSSAISWAPWPRRREAGDLRRA